MLTRKSKDWSNQLFRNPSEFGIQNTSLYQISLDTEESQLSKLKYQKLP